MTTPDNAAASEAAANAARAEKKPPKTFLQTLQDIHYGHVADELTSELAKCISESERTGKVTELVLKLKIKPVSKAQGRYNIGYDVASKLPPLEREDALMFVGPDGNLTNRDPRQKELEGFRVVDGPRAAIRPQDDEQQAGGIRVG